MNAEILFRLSVSFKTEQRLKVKILSPEDLTNEEHDVAEAFSKSFTGVSKEDLQYFAHAIVTAVRDQIYSLPDEEIDLIAGKEQPKIMSRPKKKPSSS